MTVEHDLLDAARNGAPRRLCPACGPVPGPASGLLPSNAEAPFRAGHGAMDFAVPGRSDLRGPSAVEEVVENRLLGLGVLAWARGHARLPR